LLSERGHSASQEPWRKDRGAGWGGRDTQTRKCVSKGEHGLPAAYLVYRGSILTKSKVKRMFRGIRSREDQHRGNSHHKLQTAPSSKFLKRKRVYWIPNCHRRNKKNRRKERRGVP